MDKRCTWCWTYYTPVGGMKWCPYCKHNLNRDDLIKHWAERDARLRAARSTIKAYEAETGEPF